MNIYKKKLINNSLRLNSIANYFIELTDKNDFIKLHKFIKNKNLPVLVIGEGTNVVLPDIFEGIVVKPNFNEINFNEHNNTISAGSSVNWHEFVIHTINNNIVGFENLSSIPGSVGASPIQNIGAYGQEVSNLIDKINCFDIEKGEFKTLNNSSCKFKYRNSIFKNNSLLILSVDFKTDCKKEFNIEYNSIINHMDKIGFKKTNLSLETLSNLICDIRNKTLPDPNIIPNGDLLTGHLDGWGDPEQVLDLHENLIHHGLEQQDPVLGLWSGDASMFSRSVMFNDATAYNESEYGHRTEKNQANMDSEILWNLYKRGKQLKTLEAPYYHLYHGLSRERENHWSKIKYKNSDDWGYADYNKVDINDNTVLVYGKDASIEYD